LIDDVILIAGPHADTISHLFVVRFWRYSLTFVITI
jgi:hypothetical protein